MITVIQYWNQLYDELQRKLNNVDMAYLNWCASIYVISDEFMNQ